MCWVLLVKSCKPDLDLAPTRRGVTAHLDQRAVKQSGHGVKDIVSLHQVFHRVAFFPPLHGTEDHAGHERLGGPVFRVKQSAVLSRTAFIGDANMGFHDRGVLHEVIESVVRQQHQML